MSPRPVLAPADSYASRKQLGHDLLDAGEALKRAGLMVAVCLTRENVAEAVALAEQAADRAHLALDAFHAGQETEGEYVERLSRHGIAELGTKCTCGDTLLRLSTGELDCLSCATARLSALGMNTYWEATRELAF